MTMLFPPVPPDNVLSSEAASVRTGPDETRSSGTGELAVPGILLLAAVG